MKETNLGSTIGAGERVELPFIHSRISELSWLVHSSQECAEIVETMAKMKVKMEHFIAKKGNKALRCK
jgi:hypothetical protein